MPCLRSKLLRQLKCLFAQVDRSSEEPDGEADRPNHYAEGGSGTKGTSPGKQQNAGSESPKPGRRRHSRRSSQDFDMMMRAESAGPGGGHAVPPLILTSFRFFSCQHPFSFSYNVHTMYRFHMCPHVIGHRAAFKDTAAPKSVSPLFLI